MEGLFPSRAFKDFGPNELFPAADASLYHIAGSRPGKLRVQVRAECPRLPGVYGMLNALGELVYVGKANDTVLPKAEEVAPPTTITEPVRVR